jgi:hypothetical protein
MTSWLLSNPQATSIVFERSTGRERRVQLPIAIVLSSKAFLANEG